MKSLLFLTPGLVIASLSLPSPAQADDSIAVSFALPGTAGTESPTPPSETAAAPKSKGTRDNTSPLSFAAPSPAVAPPSESANHKAPQAGTSQPQSQPPSDQLFAGGSDSLVARTVGHAEGTRGADGAKTRAYYGHVDPGNGVWNLGSFSFQHCREAQYNCSTPDQADRHQLRRLQGQTEMMRQRAERLQMELSLQEELNGIDLANQAPLAVLDSPGYIEWLKKAQEKGLKGSEAVLWARVSSYWDPRLNNWNAPGLGNEEGRITHDQNRRMTAIARALDYQQQQVATRAVPPRASSPEEPAEQRADSIIFQDLGR